MDEKEYKDIPTGSFKPISEIQEQQQNLIEQYQKKNTTATSIDLSENVRILEQKLQKKKYDIPLWIVVVIIIFINICWFIGVKVIIEPKYEEYIKQNKEITENYNSLKNIVDAIIGE